ncbi:MAG TPA: MarR family transcriptional regulator [Spirochaetia bacterium]|nr:MarR family transcriptional regulator [Spirochaetia bacterium]
MIAPELLLSNQICFLAYRLDREINARYRPLLADLGLTYPQYLVMLVLWERDGRTVGELCDTLGLDTGTISPLLKRLEAARLLVRRRSNVDERTVNVALSEAGAALAERARRIPGALGAGLGLTSQESAELYRVLSRALERITGETEAEE